MTCPPHVESQNAHLAHVRRMPEEFNARVSFVPTQLSE
jgi:hypothetical protein